MLWAADAPVEGFDPVGFFLSYGVLGAVLILALLGWVTFKPDITRLEKANTELKADFTRQVAELRRDYTEQIAELRKDHHEDMQLLRQERDKAMDQRNAMAETFQKEWIPALTKSLATVDALRALMERVIDRSRGEP